jgi:hypothetical protein
MAADEKKSKFKSVRMDPEIGYESASPESLQSTPREDTPLLPADRNLTAESFYQKTDINAILANGIMKSYDVDRLSSWRVFTTYTGTVFEDRGLWLETLTLFLVYLGVFTVAYIAKGETLHAGEEFRNWLGKEEHIRSLMDAMCNLIGLLLSFYTALNLNRWWGMRLDVHHIEEASSRLTMLISTSCTADKELLFTVQRYARASVFLIFAASQGYDSPREEALKRELLHADEYKLLGQLTSHMVFVQAETLWVWLANMLAQLEAQGLTKGPPHYCQMLAAVEQGRNGVAEIQTYLQTQIPLGYVHLLCLIVKLHNFLLNVVQALIAVALIDAKSKGFELIPLIRCTFRAFFMPFLYNAILILNAGVNDPFGGDACDFDFTIFSTGMDRKANAFINAATNLPDWLKKSRKYEPVVHKPVATA